MCALPLDEIASHYLQTYWGLDKSLVPTIQFKNYRNKLGLFECDIDINFSPSSISNPVIYISNNVAKHGSNFLIRNVLKHELCHYAMLLLNKPHADGHPFFEQELRRIGAFSSRSLHTFFVASCRKCLSYNIFPEKNKAQTFLSKICLCKSSNKDIALFVECV